MKRDTNLFEAIASLENLRLAHARAQRGKGHYSQVKKVNENPEFYLGQIRDALLSGTFTTSEYIEEARFDGRKNRVIHKLPYYPDRIVQHAIMAVCGPLWRKRLIRDTYQSIEGRGQHDARRRVDKYLKDHPQAFGMKLDVRKFYPSVDNALMLDCIGKTIKCSRTLALLKDIIYSHPGLPIGNYTSQYFGNLFLSPIDWRIKQNYPGMGYFRYCDDIVLISDDLKELRRSTDEIGEMLAAIKLDCTVISAPKMVNVSGLDFCGFVFKTDSIHVRKDILKKLKAAVRLHLANPERLLKSLCSYWGWFKPTQDRRVWRGIARSEIMRLTDGIFKKNPLRTMM
jgi:hypothetical protein